MSVVLLVAPLLAAVAALAALSTVVQTGALFAPARIKPDLGKLDPLAGLRSLASAQRLWNVARAFVAAVAVAFLAWRALSTHLADLARAIGTSARRRPGGDTCRESRWPATPRWSGSFWQSSTSSWFGARFGRDSE